MKKIIKPTKLHALEQQFLDWRFKAKNYIWELRNPQMRALLTIDAADTTGKLNGMTVVELLTIVNLTAGTNEHVSLSANGKTLTFWAEKRPAFTPEDLR